MLQVRGTDCDLDTPPVGRMANVSDRACSHLPFQPKPFANFGSAP